MPKRRKKSSTSLAAVKVPETRKPFIAHIQELRRRLFYVAVSVVAWSCAAYGVQQHIVQLLLRPAAGQNFIYTTPGGGIDFLFRVCVYTGVLCSIPVIIYQLLKYIEPIINDQSLRFVSYASAVSAILAAIGVVFGYLVGLPAALHFLLHQFTTTHITAMITIQSYMSFVLVYLLGSAVLLQVPLILVCINRIKPLQPKRLLRYERWFILGSFVLGGLLSPTPNIMDQLMLAGPMILMYQVGILIIYFSNRTPKVSKKVAALQKRDAEVQAERLAKLQAAWQTTEQNVQNHMSAKRQSIQAAAEAEIASVQKAVTSFMPPARQQTVTVAVPVASAEPPAQPAPKPIILSSRPNKYVDIMARSRAPRYDGRRTASGIG